MRFKGKSCVVTGGAGFIGGHLVDALLAEGASRVAVVDNFFLGKEETLSSAKLGYGDKLRIYRENAGDYSAVRAVINAEQPDIVFNLATKALLYSFFNPPGACKVNLDIALALGELLREETYGKLVHLSSSEVYGTAQSVPMDEYHPLLAETSYAAGKAAGDLLLASYVKMFDLDITTIRPFNNYGPRQNDGQLAAVVPLTMKRVLAGEAPVLSGDGLQTRDFIFVCDTIEAILKLAIADGLKGRVLNLGSGRETPIKTIVETLCQIMSFSGSIQYVPERKADVIRHCADVTQATSLIGEVAPTSLEEGLRQTVEWYLTKDET
ncbi:NAD-dependent epimerase/dehydratase family protein [Kiloniella sp.]|uniref:NAD-dependent epimerase/dehydratase family protein n=1 Tax=Kiloniella sp. TaxID=1938587 RepID=UPI003A8CD419